MHFLTLQSTKNEISVWHNNDKRHNVHCTSTYIRKEAENPTYTETTQQIPKKANLQKDELFLIFDSHHNYTNTNTKSQTSLRMFPLLSLFTLYSLLKSLSTLNQLPPPLPFLFFSHCSDFTTPRLYKKQNQKVLQVFFFSFSTSFFSLLASLLTMMALFLYSSSQLESKTALFYIQHEFIL